ncbi:MAG: class I SAM-dependent methyltransferase [Thermodesulfobacteriota bacterium]
MTTIHLKKGRESSLRRRHPWVFSGALARLPRDVSPGETVDLLSHDGKFLARGAISPASQITIRVWTFEPDQPVDEAFFRQQLAAAVRRRDRLRQTWPATGLRLVNAESDGLPGLIVDQYGEFLVVQFLSAGAEFWKQTITDQLGALVPCQGIYERSDAAVRSKEGLASAKGVLAGDPPPEFVPFEEGDLKFLADVVNGHKTGFYLDQRENRRLVSAFSRGAEVLNCFAYSGGFGLYALRGGAATLTNVETSGPALDLINRHLAANGLDNAPVENEAADVFDLLRRYFREGRRFDLIVLDPPKFAESRSQINRAARGYKDIALLAFRLLRPGGVLFTFSCSGLMDPALFQKITADAALDAGRSARIIARMSQAEDHPVALCFPEGAYLKGLVCQAE